MRSTLLPSLHFGHFGNHPVPDLRIAQASDARLQCSLCQSVSESRSNCSCQRCGARTPAKGTSRPLHPALIREKNICQALQQSRLNFTNQSTSKSTQLHRLILWKRVSLFVLSPAGFPFFTDHGDRRDFLSHHPIHF